MKGERPLKTEQEEKQEAEQFLKEHIEIIHITK